MIRPILTLVCVVCLGCGSSGEPKANGEVPASATSATTSRSRSGPQESTRQEQPLLADGDVRVPLFVVPGNALVEVDDALVRRRHGVVELVGKVGTARRVRLLLENGRTVETTVQIEAMGTSPAWIDANTAK